MRENLAASSGNYKDFAPAFLDKLAPYKSKKIRVNQVPYMTKNLRKAIMKRSPLKPKYLNTNITESVRLYKK